MACSCRKRSKKKNTNRRKLLDDLRQARPGMGKLGGYSRSPPPVWYLDGLQPATQAL
ncbi:unnamed protein product [Ectocarpus sp. 6 AP-2014]